MVYDVASSALVETINAHTATVWSMHIREDEQVLVSGSADKDVKFWEFERKQHDAENVRRFVAYCRAFYTGIFSVQ